MQGKKLYQEKLFIQFRLSDYVPADNIYRRLKDILKLKFLYQATAAYYGKEGQKSIDPVVFMKLMLVGYIENITSDRGIIATSSMRMDILYFLGYDLGESLPYHSTLSRTRNLYGEEQFVTLFKQILKLCIDEGLISGKRQAIDSALIPANASKHSMMERLVMEDASVFTRELNANIEDEPTPSENSKQSSKKDDQDNPARTNQTHFSPSDPDARLTMKPGKPMNLYYRAQMSVDTASHFITYIQAFAGNAADNVSLPEILNHVVENMNENDIRVKEALMDTGYSSGEAIRALIGHDIEGYIPNPGNYKNSREKDGFTYDAEQDRYTCVKGVQLPFRRIESAYEKPTIQKKIYESNISDCKHCPLKSSCANAKGFKKLSDSIDKQLYQYMQQRIESRKGKQMKRLRSSTIEPVFGSLINYTGLKRINTKGIKQANKCMLMAATAYNLKKLLKYKFKPIQEVQKQFANCINDTFDRVLGKFEQQYTIKSLSWF
jgi:transposase